MILFTNLKGFIMIRLPWFFFVSHGVLVLFLSIIVYVIAVAYLRPSGSTGMDMAAIQQMRYRSVQEETALSTIPTSP